MSRPKVFVGSSEKNLKVAGLLAQALKKDAEVIIWNEGVFDLNRGVLEGLLSKLDEFDFAVLVWAADDMTLSNGQLSPSARDNVLFECGLFMGRLGRDRVFIVCDESAELRIPSDFAGVTLARFDGSRLAGSDAPSGIRKAGRLIGDAIRKQMFNHVVGEWRSRYRLTAEMRHPLAEDDVEITLGQGRLFITNKNNSQNDYYTAKGNLAEERFLMGEWKATQARGSTSGAFLLTINPLGTMMYGYATGMDERFGTLYVTWVLAKKDGASEDEVNERLKRGEELLNGTIGGLANPA
jgi:hypothetical protein